MKNYFEKIQTLPESKRRTIFWVLMTLVILAVLFFGGKRIKQRLEEIGKRNFLKATPVVSSFFETIDLGRVALRENLKEFKKIMEISIPK